MLKIQKLHPDAKLPTVGHPGTDLGFDIHALEDTVLKPGVQTAVRTGISASFSLSGKPVAGFTDIFEIQVPPRKFGLLFKDRSSMAAKGITVSAGVIDAGYTGELKVLLTYHATPRSTDIFGGLVNPEPFKIEAGTRVAQMLPTEVFTAESIVEVASLDATTRGAGGFGSTGA